MTLIVNQMSQVKINLTVVVLIKKKRNLIRIYRTKELYQKARILKKEYKNKSPQKYQCAEFV